MVKLDVTLLRYLTRDDFRVLTAVEMGMRNHELVPRSLVYSISGIQNGSIAKILLNLTQNKLLSYERGKRYDGYRLTYRGYDYLALNVLRTRGILSSIGNQIGVGKESDVYVGSNDEGRQFAIKFHRLGRTCFRKVSEKRDYQKKSQNHKTASWLYLSRLAAIREFAFMKLLYERKLLPIPEPIDYNRHIIVMELIDGCILNHINRDDITDKSEVAKLYEKLMQLIMKLANDFGVVHGDFNEFNILIKLSGSFDPVLIDFPQMISINHELASDYFERDVNCITDFFLKRFSYESDSIPCFELLKIEDVNSDLQHLADAMENEETIFKHLDNNNQLNKMETNKDNSAVSCKDKTDENQSDYKENEILSKFLNSLPMNLENTLNEDMLYDQMNSKQLEEAEKKVILEKKLYELKLSGIEELNENDDNGQVPDCEPIAKLQEVNNVNEDNYLKDDCQFDRQSVRSNAYSTASTFSQQEVKSRLMREKKKRELRDKMKVNCKNIKGDANALRRRKKNDQALANEDLKAYVTDSLW